MSKQASAAEYAVFRHLIQAGEILGWVPVGLLDERNGMLDRTRQVHSDVLDPSRRYVITAAVRDPGPGSLRRPGLPQRAARDGAGPGSGGDRVTDYLDSLGHFILSRYAGRGDTLTRMERLPVYSVTSDGGDFEAWKAGASVPASSERAETVADLRQERANGQIRRRVRILSAALTDYERYSIEFGYLQNAEAGEDVRVLRHGEHPIPSYSTSTTG